MAAQQQQQQMLAAAQLNQAATFQAATFQAAQVQAQIQAQARAASFQSLQQAAHMQSSAQNAAAAMAAASAMDQLSEQIAKSEAEQMAAAHAAAAMAAQAAAASNSNGSNNNNSSSNAMNNPIATVTTPVSCGEDVKFNGGEYQLVAMEQAPSSGMMENNLISSSTTELNHFDESAVNTTTVTMESCLETSAGIDNEPMDSSMVANDVSSSNVVKQQAPRIIYNSPAVMAAIVTSPVAKP